jgi:hypothetical protein
MHYFCGGRHVRMRQSTFCLQYMRADSSDSAVAPKMIGKRGADPALFETASFVVSDIIAGEDSYSFSVCAGDVSLGTFRFPTLPQAMRAAEEMREMLRRVSGG